MGLALLAERVGARVEAALDAGRVYGPHQHRGIVVGRDQLIGGAANGRIEVEGGLLRECVLGEFDAGSKELSVESFKPNEIFTRFMGWVLIWLGWLAGCTG